MDTNNNAPLARGVGTTVAGEAESNQGHVNRNASAPQLVKPYARQLDNIPQELRALKQWCVSTDRDKAPRLPTGKLAEVNNSATWSTFPECVAAIGKTFVDREKVVHTVTHAGYVESKDDPFTIIDLDPAKDANGVPLPYDHPSQVIMRRNHANVLACFDTYTERSRSGLGYHIVIRGKKPPNSGTRRTGIEVYDDRHFLIFTGDVVGDQQGIEDHQEELNDICDKILGKTFGDPHDIPDGEEVEDDATVLMRCDNQINFEKFTALYEGRWQGMYESESHADAGLIQWIARHTKSNAQVKRIFEATPLGQRPKMQKRFAYLFGRALWKARNWLAENEKEREAQAAAEIVRAVAEDDPVDLFSPPRPRPLDLVASLPQELSEFAQVWGASTGHDPTGYAYALLPVVAAAFDRRTTLSYRSSWKDSLILWTGLVGKSGEGKSPTLTNTVGLLNDLNDAEKAVHAQAKQLAKEDKTAPRAPVNPSLYAIQECTIEPLIDIAGNCTHGILRHVDEGSAFLNGMGRYANASGEAFERSSYLTAHNGGPFAGLRMGREMPPIDRWGVNLAFNITPSKLKEGYAEAAVDGMLARMLMYEVTHQSGQTANRSMNADPIFQSLRRLVWEFAHQGPRLIQLSPAASEHFEERVKLFRELTAMMDGDEGLSGVYGKAAPHTGRIAALFELVSSRGQSTVVSERSMILARSFMAHAIAESERLHKHVFGRDTPYGIAQRCAIKILTFGEDRITREQLMKVEAFRKAKDFERDAALRCLRDHKWLIAPDTKRVRDGFKFHEATAWLVNPKVHAKFKDIAEQERQNAQKLLALMDRAKKS